MGLSDEIAKGLGLSVMMAVHQEELGSSNSGQATLSRQSGLFLDMHEILDGLGDQGHKSTAAAGLAHTLCVLGRFDEVEGYASEAVSVAADDDLISHVMGRSALARVLAARGDFVGAEQLPRESHEMFDLAEDPHHQGDLRGTRHRNEDDLTPRELDILGLLSEGRSNRSIAPSHW